MTITVTKPQINVREELNNLRQPTGNLGAQLLKAETVSDAYNLLGTFSYRNVLHNGDFKICQRGQTQSNTVTYSTINTGTSDTSFFVDRWQLNRYNNSGTFAVSTTVSRVSDHPVGAGGQCVEIKAAAAYTPTVGVDYSSFYQMVEAQNCYHMHGPSAQPSTVSFWVKSNKPGPYSIQFRVSGAVGGGSNPTLLKKYTINQADTWEYKTINIPAQTIQPIGQGNTSGCYVGFLVGGGVSSAYDATIANTENKWYQYSSNGLGFADQTNLYSAVNNYIRFTDVQWEVGTAATPFERRSYTTEDNLCKRYYYQAPVGVFGHAAAFSAARIDATIPLPVEMRAAPNIISPSGSTYFRVYVGGVSTTFNSVLINGSTKNFILIYQTGLSGLSTGASGWIETLNAPIGVGFSAEI